MFKGGDQNIKKKIIPTFVSKRKNNVWMFFIKDILHCSNEREYAPKIRAGTGRFCTGQLSECLT